MLCFIAGRDPCQFSSGRSHAKGWGGFFSLFLILAVYLCFLEYSLPVLYSPTLLSSQLPPPFRLYSPVFPCPPKAACFSRSLFSVSTTTRCSKAGDRAGNGQSLASGNLLSRLINASNLMHLCFSDRLVPCVPSPVCGKQDAPGSDFTGAEGLVLGCW